MLNFKITFVYLRIEVTKRLQVNLEVHQHETSSYRLVVKVLYLTITTNSGIIVRIIAEITSNDIYLIILHFAKYQTYSTIL